MSVIVYQTRIETPLGIMLAGATQSHVCLLEFSDRPMPPARIRRIEKAYDCTFVQEPNEVLHRLERELTHYYAGTLETFRTPVDAFGTPFQRRVWQALRTIPFGHVRSYADQARSIGAPQAVRAVARANGDNPIAILLPCHRVIASDGSLAGYGGGLWRKKALLDLERSGLTGDLFALNPAARPT